MLELAIILLVVSIISGAFGFRGVSSVTGTIAKVLFFIFLAAFLIIVIGVVLLGWALF